jgi:Holliday junction resolvasome RuvABC endonuclease subunit
MRRIGGLDTSLTSTGIAIITRRVNGTCLANVTTIASKGKRNASIVSRSERLLNLRNDILHALLGCELVVIEMTAFGMKGGSALDRNGLWWAIVGKLCDIGTPVACCAITTNKKFATGSGRADKAAVSAAVSRLWPEVNITKEDEADALSLAHIGAVKAGWEVPTLQRHRDALPAVAWPDQPVTELEETA